MFNATASELLRQPKVEFIGLGFGFGGGLGLNAQMNERTHLQVQGQYTYFTNRFRAESSVFGTGSDKSETPFKIPQVQLGLAWLIRL